MQSCYREDWRAANGGSNVADQVSDDECRGLFRIGLSGVYAYFWSDGRFVTQSKSAGGR
jgi:hypothetical protein